MSFTFNWPRFSDQFHHDAIQMLNNALNKGNKPPVIADKIEVVELEMGSQPPELEIRDIGDLTTDQFRGIFRMTYAGDAHLVLRTKVQANPLNHKQPDIHLMTGSRGMLAAKQPLVVPMLLRLSHFKLNSYVVLVVSKQKGITLVFKTDPLQSVDINSTFDSIAVIQKFIQREIEGQLRQMFREDLPGIIHRLSQQWIKAKVEAPYLAKHPPLNRQSIQTTSSPDLSYGGLSRVGLLRPALSSGVTSRTRSMAGSSVVGSNRSTAPNPEPPKPSTSVGDLADPEAEVFDPTYGLRPEGLPTKTLFRTFSNLFTPNKGLANLTEDPEERTDFGDDSTDYYDYEESEVPASHGVEHLNEEPAQTEFETLPAVGGGTITRPRIYHSQSIPCHAPTDSSYTPASRPLSGTFSAHSVDRFYPHQRPALTRAHLSSQNLAHHNPYFPPVSSPLHLHHNHMTVKDPFPLNRPSRSDFSDGTRRVPYPSPPLSNRTVSPDSLETDRSRSSSGLAHSIATPPSFDPPHDDDSAIYMRPSSPSQRSRRLSVSSSAHSNSFHDTLLHHATLDDGTESDTRRRKIVLRPSLNGSISQLSSLTYSNHTLSPYTQSVQHFTVRSALPRGIKTSGLAVAEKPPVKAKRKRIYRVGRTKDSSPGVDSAAGHGLRRRSRSPVPPSEFDASDRDRYFRSQDDLDFARRRSLSRQGLHIHVPDDHPP